MYLNRLESQPSCASQLSSHHKKTVELNRKYLSSFIETIQWLCKQGLEFRGHDESEHSKNRGNFLELIEEILEFADTYGIERPSNRKKGRKRVRTETDSTEIDALES